MSISDLPGGHLFQLGGIHVAGRQPTERSIVGLPSGQRFAFSILERAVGVELGDGRRKTTSAEKKGVPVALFEIAAFGQLAKERPPHLEKLVVGHLGVA